jgi:hypothetical protein
MASGRTIDGNYLTARAPLFLPNRIILRGLERDDRRSTCRRHLFHLQEFEFAEWELGRSRNIFVRSIFGASSRFG